MLAQVADGKLYGSVHVPPLAVRAAVFEVCVRVCVRDRAEPWEPVSDPREFQRLVDWKEKSVFHWKVKALNI